MKLDEAIAAIEAAETVDDLRRRMQVIAEAYGFASYNFLDAGRPHVETPFYFGTTGPEWENEYQSNGFVHIDPCVARVRRTNTPFVWASVEVPEPRTGPKSPVRRLMEAAQDFGFTEGLVVPCHFRDQLGQIHSASSVFYWKDKVSRFSSLLANKKHDLHIIMIYFVQRCMDIIAVQHRHGIPVIDAPDAKRTAQLTDRERGVLSWAARGKTASETADIMKISEKTAETHIKNALRKLDVVNKTHAVAKCITLGLIDAF